MTTRLACVLLLTSLFACGGDDNNNTPMPDAPGSAAQMITITGTTKVVSASGSNPLAGVTVGAYQNSDENTAVATATSDTAGVFTLTVATNGHPLDGYIKSSVPSYLDTYLYPPSAITADYSGAAINIVNESTLEALSTICGHGITNSQGVIGVEVFDAAMMPVGGAVISSTPAAMKYCYNGSSPLPDSSKTMTSADGIGYMIDLTGDVMVSATKAGATFATHTVKVRTNALTTTL
ncbi:MAG: hypothetical protein ABI678_25285, partial [Kofleriaceae bacterium]